MDHLLNVKQASIILGLSPGTIRHYTECGLLPDVRNPHNCRVFRLDDLLRFKNSRIKFRKTGEMLGERLFRLSKSQGRKGTTKNGKSGHGCRDCNFDNGL